MRPYFSGALLQAAALLALGGCANTLPERSTAAVPSNPPVAEGAVISPTPAPVATAPGIVVPPGSSVVTTTTTSGTPGSATTYAPTQTAGIVPGALPAQLRSSEILPLVGGNTATGVASNGQTYYVHFLRDGRMRFRENDFRDTGSWRVTSDNQLCSTLTKINAGVEECYTLYPEGNNVAFERNGTRVGTFTVLSGNPQNL
jgi:hypothetical protein